MPPLITPNSTGQSGNLVLPNFNVNPIQNPMQAAAQALGIQQKPHPQQLAMQDAQDIRAAIQKSAQARNGQADTNDVTQILNGSNPRAAMAWQRLPDAQRQPLLRIGPGGPSMPNAAPQPIPNAPNAPFQGQIQPMANTNAFDSPVLTPLSQANQ